MPPLDFSQLTSDELWELHTALFKGAHEANSYWISHPRLTSHESRQWKRWADMSKDMYDVMRDVGSFSAVHGW